MTPSFRSALDRATDLIEPEATVETVLREAGRRRARRRGALTATAASLIVLLVVGGVQVWGPVDRSAPIPPVDTPTSTPTGTVQLTGQRWDPLDVDRLPEDQDRPAGLPASVVPPAEAPDLLQTPVDAVVMAVVDGNEAMLLSTSGEWRSLRVPGSAPRVSVSPQGTRLILWRYAGRAGETEQVVDVPTGTITPVAYPDGFQGTDLQRWEWRDEESLVLSAFRGGWRIEAAGGEAERTPYPRADHEWTVDPAGDVLDSRGTAAFNDWATGGLRDATNGLPQFARLSADDDTVAGTSYDFEGGRGFSVDVLDRGTLTPRARLRIRDPGGFYGNYGLGTLAVADDGSVLLRVIGPDRSDLGFRVVRWDPASDDLSLVTTVELGDVGRFGSAAVASFASGLLRADP